MDPVRNPFAPGAGQRPPELAGRDRELAAFDVVLERVARGRPERSLVLTGLRGVGKTVLLGELRSMAVRRGWGAGKIEARPEADLRRPLSAGPPPGGPGGAVLIEEMEEAGRDDIPARGAACHELSQSGAPLVVVGAGLPHLPAVLSASKSYSERLFRYVRIDRLDRADADQAVVAPVAREDASITDEALDALFDAAGGYPYFIQAYGKAAWDAAPSDPITA